MDQGKSGHRGKGAGRERMTNSVTVTVTPGIPQGKNVDVTLTGSCVVDNEIHLALDDDCDITFALSPANGVNSWDPQSPFVNAPGEGCPPAGVGPGHGPSGPFQQNSNASKSMSVGMTKRTKKYQTKFRLNFNDGYTCDPIIVVG